MKTLLCTVAMCSLLGLRVQAQDQLKLINGDSLNVSIVKIGEDIVEYSFPGETIINEVLKSRVHIIVFESGRKEVINEIVKIEGEEDWIKVKIISQSEAKGLKKMGSFEEKVTGPYMAYDNALSKAKMNASKKAATLNCAYVVILSEGSAGFPPVIGAKIKFEVYE